jgi:hypothetical protein
MADPALFIPLQVHFPAEVRPRRQGVIANCGWSSNSCTLMRAIQMEEDVRDYLPYIFGCGVGLLFAVIFSAVFEIDGTPQLLVFAGAPAIGGAISERFIRRR